MAGDKIEPGEALPVLKPVAGLANPIGAANSRLFLPAQPVDATPSNRLI
jgi:hypothetical protein